MIEAQEYLNKAHFFSDKAVAVETQDRTQFTYFFETAIVWARSVTFVLQRQYSGTPGFEDWYKGQQSALGSDPLAKFFVNQRNFVLKQRSVSMRKVVTLKAHVVVGVRVTATVTVTRGSWRSKLRYLRQDSLANVKQRIGKIRRRLRRRKLRKPKREPTSDAAADRIYFVEEPWNKEPAIILLNRYLDLLHLLVDNAVKQFGELR